MFVTQRSVLSEQKGRGIGAIVSAAFVGNGPGQIPPGSTMRVVVGGAGANDGVETCVVSSLISGSGRGRSGVLLLKPGPVYSISELFDRFNQFC